VKKESSNNRSDSREAHPNSGVRPKFKVGARLFTNGKKRGKLSRRLIGAHSPLAYRLEPNWSSNEWKKRRVGSDKKSVLSFTSQMVTDQRKFSRRPRDEAR